MYALPPTNLPIGNFKILATSFKYFAIFWFVSSAVYVHSRGKIKTPWKHRFTGFFTFLAPFNVFWYLFSDVPNTPFTDTNKFPELLPLRDNWEMIRDEALALNQQGLLQQPSGVAFKTFAREDRWRHFYLTWYGKEYAQAKQFLPKTLELVAGIPNISACMIARLNPGKQLTLHRDPFSVSLRYHLGLITPNSDKCRINVDGEGYYWRDGEAVIFDETFMHEAINETDQERLILFCDIRRPMCGPISRWFALRSHKTIGYLTAGSNSEIEHDSWFSNLYTNHLFPQYRKARTFRRHHRKLYYAIKYLLFIGLLVLILK